MHPCPILRLLVIEDDPAMTRLVEKLRDPGWEVVTAASQDDAVEKLGQWPCWIVLTGLKTRIAEDLKFFAKLRSLQPAAKLLVFANEGTPEDVLSALRAGVVAVFLRDFPAGDVVHFIRGLRDIPDWRDGIEVLSARPEWVTLRVVPRLFTADRVAHYLEDLRMDLPAEIRDQIGFAFREMLINAMEHGAKFDESKRVEITAMRTARTICYHLRDPGEGFKMKALPHAAIGNTGDDPTAHIALRAEAGLRTGGFGMLIARELVDEFVYNEKGNEVLLIKHLDRKAS
jgi:anti-sigma regulatory factor (Ser/Thr protein kinase)/CheY-like chemotaxis protein